jgi:LPS-assembly lipoprotein
MSSSNASYGQENVCLQDDPGVRAERRNHSGIARLARIGLAASLTLTLSGCFRPLYGPTARGESLQAVMASIDVPENQLADQYAQVEHDLRSELIFNLNGSGIPAPKAYKLTLGYSQVLATPIVDSVSGRALSATVQGTLRYTLTTLDGSKTITTGTVYSNATYDRFEQRFASIRANRDAQIRVARDLAGQVRTNLAAALATRT